MMLDAGERRNLEAIAALNQRGGRMLSLVDLLASQSVSLEMAAYLASRVSSGASFLTAANPGAAGKTTVMGALLGCLPPGAIIRMVDTPASISATEQTDAPVWHVCHELGKGRIRGYLWGEELGAYFRLMGEGNYLASNLHADTLPEVRRALCGPPNELDSTQLARMDLLITLRMEGGQRWVNSVFASDGHEHRPLFAHNPRQGSLPLADGGAPLTGLNHWTDFLGTLLREKVCSLPEFRARLLDFISSGMTRA